MFSCTNKQAEAVHIFMTFGVMPIAFLMAYWQYTLISVLMTASYATSFIWMTVQKRLNKIDKEDKRGIRY